MGSEIRLVPQLPKWRKVCLRGSAEYAIIERQWRVKQKNVEQGTPPFHDIVFYYGPMKFMDIVEPHNPIRVLRQIGHVQRILRDSYRPIEADRSRLRQLYSVKYSYGAQVWEDWEGHLESVEQRCQKVDYPYQTSSDYME
ncbi:hypothetical protein Syun_031783 [Stephania yunnanensis]|uniref:Uncharacterized protein n=1 Tax=Stephania yunnanensis TaxID=152371 RepID=A0AAP0E387_9MAGN